MFGYIYMFTNRINGKRYIGQHIGNEIDENYFGSGCIFKNAKDKYGLENFKFEILAICDTKDDLDNAEKYFIGFKYYSFANTQRGYNIAIGGDGGNAFAGKTEEEMNEIRKKISEAHKRENLSEETKKKMSKAQKGKKISEEHKRKISQAMKGEKLSEKTKEKISKAKKGEKHPRSKKVRAFTDSKTLDKVFNYMLEAGKELGVKYSNISKCCQGKLKSAGKFNGEKIYWEYVEENDIEVVA